LFLAFVLSGCASTYSYSNKPLNSDIDNAAAGKASYKVSSDRGCYKNHDSKGDRCHEKTLVILALSGGGSRAAYFSASVMLELEKVFSEEGLNLLEEVDVISSVSGGSLPAAYYAVSRDRDDNSYRMTDRAWDEATVRKLMRKNYLGAWFRRWFWPQNIYRYWFTAYDRSDIMADVFADNLYDSKFPGFDYDFSRLQEDRPNLVLNATNGTMGARFGHTFSFTKEDFSKLGSDISR
ncbi:MAG: patatin-like phospholipase family protein, partial [Gammaproteobacteria bacterium]|nr:patatin-like phospholipase family protein [Gammaproteobacteria bacterium]NIR94224.1 patatin-like phospholipase family protein [Gammaproteobacteria bacterium]NIT52537.1 patatin-like phospholipase family protein [candidate division Zixibacteria bacterium]NIW47343.1 patatin-like phospholipase family protein [Gammaproteobacteria bacterium]NIX57881.1 patatin-like phospholipase family protein [candidate division Zixibacteria bacterium]